MASSEQVRQYLAYWFQLGKPILRHHHRERMVPTPVMAGDRYSQEFEQLWQQVQASQGEGWYLEGTSWSIAQLLTPKLEISDCARCSMPVPMVSLGTNPLDCPCSDLPLWPNQEYPSPLAGP